MEAQLALLNAEAAQLASDVKAAAADLTAAPAEDKAMYKEIYDNLVAKEKQLESRRETLERQLGAGGGGGSGAAAASDPAQELCFSMSKAGVGANGESLLAFMGLNMLKAGQAEVDAIVVKRPYKRHSWSGKTSEDAEAPELCSWLRQVLTSKGVKISETGYAVKDVHTRRKLLKIQVSGEVDISGAPDVLVLPANTGVGVEVQAIQLMGEWKRTCEFETPDNLIWQGVAQLVAAMIKAVGEPPLWFVTDGLEQMILLKPHGEIIQQFITGDNLPDIDHGLQMLVDRLRSKRPRDDEAVQTARHVRSKVNPSGAVAEGLEDQLLTVACFEDPVERSASVYQVLRAWACGGQGDA